jgi:membrane protein
MRNNSYTFWLLLKEVFKKWQQDNAFRLAASLSYYTIFSIGPLLIITLKIAAIVFGSEAAEGGLRTQLNVILGPSGTEAVQSILLNFRKASSKLTLFGIGMLFLGAMGVFVELRTALNLIWKVKTKNSKGIIGFIKNNLLSFAMVLSIGCLLLLSLVLSATVTILIKYFESNLPIPKSVLSGMTSVFSFGIILLLFAIIFKILPAKIIQWKDVWIGAFLSTVFFTLGKIFIALYLKKGMMLSAYGASSSIILLLIWAYYSALVLYLGAEFTEVYSRQDS